MARTKQKKRGRNNNKNRGNGKLGQEAVSSTNLSIEDFIKACEDMDSSDDMKTIIEKKIRKHYNGAERSFTASSSFQKLLKEQLEKLKVQPKDLFVHIHELVNELKARKASANLQEPPAKKRKTGPESSSVVDYEAVEEKRTEMKIKKLSSTLSKLQKMIAHLETQEVSWDEDEDADSSYIMLQRYKDRAVKVFDKLCDYTKESKSAGKIVKIAFTGSEISKVNKCIEQFVNRTGQFPDYLDILDVIKKANSEDNLKLTEEKIEEIAKKAFTDVGEELQRQRRHGDAESLFSFIESKDVDPADEDTDLKEKLLENKIHWDNINEVIDDFVSRSNEKKETQSDEEKGSDEEEGSDEEDEDEEDEGEIPELLNLSDPDSDDDKGSSSKSASDEAVSSRAESPSSKAEGDDLRPTSPNGNPVGSSSSPTPVNENVADFAETPDGPSPAEGDILQNKEA